MENNNTGFMEIEMRYLSEFGEETVVKKKIPNDWLDLDELNIFHEVYKQFLNACTFFVDSGDEIILKRNKKISNKA